jgi:hypothetical protein
MKNGRGNLANSLPRFEGGECHPALTAAIAGREVLVPEEVVVGRWAFRRPQYRSIRLSSGGRRRRSTSVSVR